MNDKEMTRAAKITIFAVIAIIIVAALLYGGYAYWARPGRLSESSCRDLVHTAWTRMQSGRLTGRADFGYRLGERFYRVRVDANAADNFPVLADILSGLVPQVAPDEAFAERIKMAHSGRALIAGRVIERIRLAPVQYTGDLIELWIDPENGDTLAWRRLDPKGRFIRGWRMAEAGAFEPYADVNSVARDGEDIHGELPNVGDSALLRPDEIDEVMMRRIMQPEWTPPGFRFIGMRTVPSLHPPSEIESMLPGLGVGRMRGGMGGLGGVGMGPMRGAQGHFQLVYTDGLNTISVVQIPVGRLLEIQGDPGRIQEVLNSKSREVQRIFHTTMIARVMPGSVVMLFGEVAPEVLRQVAESISPPADLPPDGMRPPLMDGDGEGIPAPPIGRPGGPGLGPRRDRSE